MKKFSLWSVLLVLVLFVSACGGGGSSETGGDGISEDGILTIGETGLYATKGGEFEVTINSVKKEAGGDGETALRGTYVVANVTITSRATETTNLEKVLPFKIFVDDIVNWNTVTAGKEFSFGKQIAGDLAGGDSITGELIFDARESETYKILLGGKAEPNKLEWSLASEDFQ